MKIVLQDIVREISKATKLALPDAQVVAKKLLSTLEGGLLSGQRIEIRDFGVFQTKTVAGKKGRDLSRNLSIPLPAYKKVSFRAGKNVRKLFRGTPLTPQPIAAVAAVAVGKNGQLEMLL